MTWTARIALMLCCALLIACASRGIKVRSEPPTLQLESIALEPGRVRLAVLVHNPNDHPVVLDGASLAMRIDGSELFADDWPLDLDIGPSVTERLRLETRTRSGAARSVLERSRDRDATVGYVLDVEVRVDGSDPVRGNRADFLHPVPGQPGQFR